ncbi:endonuclease III [Pseudohyphozyma bogoriensis]|nr:endonuclease III [Pseudohyphozyma bogoriensis]
MKATRSTYNSRVTLISAPETSTSTTAIDTKPAIRKRTRSTASLAADAATDYSDDVKPAKIEKKPKVASPRKPPVFKVALDKAHPAPKRWEEAYEIIRKQREGIVAPVDTMGCEQGGRERTDEKPSQRDERLSILVSLMLSSQTKDPVTHQAVANLRNNLPGGLTLESLLAASVDEIDAQICKVGFHATKALNLTKLAVRLRDLHGGEVPEDLPSLLAINGVGPKMSILFLQAIGINAGIGVDVHVHRITNRLGWHKPATTLPEQTRLNLESWLPKVLHPKINLMLVGFGQTICKPVGPRCDLCDVAKVPRLCPSRRVVSPKKEGSASPLKKLKGEEKEEEESDEKSKPKVEVEVEEAVVKSEVLGEEESAVVKEEVEVKVKNELVW